MLCNLFKFQKHCSCLTYLFTSLSFLLSMKRRSRNQ